MGRYLTEFSPKFVTNIGSSSQDWVIADWVTDEWYIFMSFEPINYGNPLRCNMVAKIQRSLNQGNHKKVSRYPLNCRKVLCIRRYRVYRNYVYILQLWSLAAHDSSDHEPLMSCKNWWGEDVDFASRATWAACNSKWRYAIVSVSTTNL